MAGGSGPRDASGKRGLRQLAVGAEAPTGLAPFGSMDDDIPFLAGLTVWRGGPVGGWMQRALQAKWAGDMETYRASLEAYWDAYGKAKARREQLAQKARPVRKLPE